jgi:hypothetical protein
MTTPTPIAAGDKVTWYEPPVWNIQAGRMDTGTVVCVSYQPIGAPFARVENKYGQRSFVNLNKLTRIEAAPSPLRRAVDGDFSGEER